MGHSIKCAILGIPYTKYSADISYNISKAAGGELVGSLLGGTNINYVGHRVCVRGANVGARKEREYSEIKELDRKKELVVGQER